jgi:hypothetical protein
MTEMDGWKDRWTVVVESAGTVSCRVGVPGLLEVEETLDADELVASTISSCPARTCHGDLRSSSAAQNRI